MAGEPGQEEQHAQERATAEERLAAARAQAAARRAAVSQLMASSTRAMLRAAETHERAAARHERSAAAGVGDRDEHRRLAAFYRDAAEAGRLMAERSRSLLSGDEAAAADPEPGPPEVPPGRQFPSPGGAPAVRQRAHAAQRAFLAQVRQRVARPAPADLLARQLEAELQRTGRLQMVGQLTSGIAHDFGNLLAVIIGYAELAEDEAASDPDPELRRLLREIRFAAERALSLSGDLLAFSRRGRGQSTAIDLDALVADLQDVLRVSTGSRAKVIIQRSPAGLPAIMADRHQLEQILLNLAVNASDAMPEGGTLTIATSVAEFDDDRVRLHPGSAPGRYVELVVQDTGTGMSADVQARIFDRFFTTKPAGAGTGLGLATVDSIITGLGGVIEVGSQQGRGTTFRIYLPAAP